MSFLAVHVEDLDITNLYFKKIKSKLLNESNLLKNPFTGNVLKVDKTDLSEVKII